MATSGFASDAAYFDRLAAQSTNHLQRDDLHAVAECYRSIARSQRAQDLSDPRHWTLRADECRTLAGQFRSYVCREQLYRLAVTYDALAGYAQKRRLARCAGLPG
jgi:hypothetical protein